MSACHPGFWLIVVVFHIGFRHEIRTSVLDGVLCRRGGGWSLHVLVARATSSQCATDFVLREPPNPGVNRMVCCDRRVKRRLRLTAKPGAHDRRLPRRLGRTPAAGELNGTASLPLPALHLPVPQSIQFAHGHQEVSTAVAERSGDTALGAPVVHGPRPFLMATSASPNFHRYGR